MAPTVKVVNSSEVGAKIEDLGTRLSFKKLANHLADVHELYSEERQPYLIRAKLTALVDLRKMF